MHSVEHPTVQAGNTVKVPNSIWTSNFLIITYLLLPRMNLLVYFTVLIDLLLAIMFRIGFHIKAFH